MLRILMKLNLRYYLYLRSEIYLSRHYSPKNLQPCRNSAGL